MKNINHIHLEKYNDPNAYQFVEAFIYKDLHDTFDGYYDVSYRTAISFELEDNEDSQYPLDDVLDKFLVHVESFLETQNEASLQEGITSIELGGALDSIRNVLSIIGKHVFNEDFIDEDGIAYVKLVIE